MSVYTLAASSFQIPNHRPSASRSKISVGLRGRERSRKALEICKSRVSDTILFQNILAAGDDEAVDGHGLMDTHTPLVDALKASVRRDTACFHFPGHNKGAEAPLPLSRLIGLNPFIYDSPEIARMAVPISDAEKLASGLFGSQETRFLVGGSTCGIQAAIMSTCSPGDTLVLPRNSHKSTASAMVLSGAEPKYVFPEYNSEWEIAGGVVASQVKQAIRELERDGRKVGAVLVVSPTYHGLCSNVEEIANVCHSHGVPLVVDEAHGGHFRFHSLLPCSALEQGADIVIQSTHKVLGSLTQSSMLHISGDLIDRDRINDCLRVLQTSSPSYLLLASLDAARAQLARMSNSGFLFDDAVSLSVGAQDRLLQTPGVHLLSLRDFDSGFAGMDPLRITVGVWELGMTGYEADGVLNEEHGVVSELVGSRSITFPVNVGNRVEDVDRLVFAIGGLSMRRRERERPSLDHAAGFGDVDVRLSPREAFFAKKESVEIVHSVGRVCGEMVFPFPPGIPILFPGEIVTEEALSYLLQVKQSGAVITGTADRELSSLVVCKQ